MSEFGLNQNIQEDTPEPINIGFEAHNETESTLSNFAHTPFELDGVYYESVEGFWQSIKFPEGSEERQAVAQMLGPDAKKASRKVKKVIEITYDGKAIQVGSDEHQDLMRQALWAKFQQNPKASQLLLATGNKPITHVLVTPDGHELPDSKTIPGKIFSQMLMDIRTELRSA